jgi:hypothetical protein
MGYQRQQTINSILASFGSGHSASANPPWLVGIISNGGYLPACRTPSKTSAEKISTLSEAIT